MTPLQKRRVLLIVLFLFLLFSLLVAQFYHIQILEGEKWAKQASRQHFFVINEPARRGLFYSNGSARPHHPIIPTPLVMDVVRYHLYADPDAIPSYMKEIISQEVSTRLSSHSLTPHFVCMRLERPSRSQMLAMWLTPEAKDQLIAWWHPFAHQNRIARNALFFIKDYQRSYPFGSLAGQLLHTLQPRKDHKTGLPIPTGGLELFFNGILQGKEGKRRLMRSPRHALEIDEILCHPKPGADIYLTIDLALQAIVEEELERGVKRSKGKGGWAVMMDPRTGDILAMAQYPFFNPTQCAQFFSSSTLIEHTKIKAITDAHEPGSVFKPFTVALALTANRELVRRGDPPLFSPEEKMATHNTHFPGRKKPLSDTSLHYFLNLDMAMQKSSNVYMARLAERMVARLGPLWYRSQLQSLFGLGQKTGIQLPAESAGVLPMPGKRHRNGTLEWSTATPFSLAMGHNVQVTTLQLLRAYAVFANGGYLVTPTLVRAIATGERALPPFSSAGLITQSPFPKVLDSQIVDRVVRAMRYVTKPGGTAFRADVPGYTEVGKTSTPKKLVNGRYSDTLYCPLFAGFCPVNNPSFVLVVTIDEPEYGYIPGVGKNHNGGNCTAHVFREISKRALESLGISPDDPCGYPVGDLRRDVQKADWMKETRQLQERYNQWNRVSY